MEHAPRVCADAGGDARDLLFGSGRRYHLFGATEGWLEVGHLGEPRKDLEIRWFDRDHDGYLDTRQIYLPDRPDPVHVARFSPRARRVALDREALTKEYHTRVLPEAIADNLRMIEALKKIAPSTAGEAYETLASKAEHPERKRYCLDIARELHFLAVRDALYARAADSPYPATLVDRSKWRSVAPGSKESGYSMGDSLRFWSLATQTEQFIQHYDDGRYAEAARTLDAIAAETASAATTR